MRVIVQVQQQILGDDHKRFIRIKQGFKVVTSLLVPIWFLSMKDKKPGHIDTHQRTGSRAAWIGMCPCNPEISEISSVLFDVLPFFVLQDFGVFSEEDGPGFLILCQLVQHPVGHVSVGAHQHLLMFCPNCPCPDLLYFIRDTVIIPPLRYRCFHRHLASWT